MLRTQTKPDLSHKDEDHKVDYINQIWEIIVRYIDVTQIKIESHTANTTYDYKRLPVCAKQHAITSSL